MNQRIFGKILAYNGGLHVKITNSMDNTVGSLTQTQRSIVIGSLLGDGYLRIAPGRRNAFLECNHSFSAREYVDWKYKKLELLCRSAPKMRFGNGNRKAYRFTTRQSSEFSSLYRWFYDNGKKRVPSDLKLDPLMLSVWFMDDGSKCRECDVYLNTQQFDIENQHKCVVLLAGLNIESALNKDKTYWRVRIKKSSLPAFWNIIAPHMIPFMTYKLGYNPVETFSA